MNAAAERMHAQTDAQFVAELPSILKEFRMGVAPRVIAAVVTAAFALIWLPPAVALPPLAFILLHEFVLFPLAIKRFILANAGERPSVAVHAYRATLFSGALAYAACWGVLYSVGEAIPIFICAGWLWGAALHNQVYFSRRADLYFTSLMPHLLVGVVLPFFMELPWWGPWVMGFSSLFTLGNFALGYFDRRRLAVEAALDRSARESAEAASQAKSQFLATMSHELRTPLNAIIGYAEILEEDIDADDAKAEDARRVQRAAHHLLTLINEVLDLSKIEAGRIDLAPAPTDVAALLRETLDGLAPLARQNGNVIALETNSSLPPVLVDAKRLKQCVLNLAGNACKFTASGRISARVGYDGAILTIAVSDTGPGIAAHDLQRLFEPFEQLDNSAGRKHSGAGLGLSITAKLARAMGGDVLVESAPGRGSTFTLRIVAEPAARRSQAA